MAETNALLAGQEPTLNIEDEVIFLDSLNEVETLSTLSPVKMDYNAIVHCRRGRVLLELGGNQQVKVTAGQMLLVPAQKLMHPMMVSTDVDAGVLLVSDSVLKSVLGTQIDIWNRAMYLHETGIVPRVCTCISARLLADRLRGTATTKQGFPQRQCVVDRPGETDLQFVPRLVAT